MNKKMALIVCIILLMNLVCIGANWCHINELNERINELENENQNLKNLLGAQYAETIEIANEYESKIVELENLAESRINIIEKPKSTRDKIKIAAKEIGIDPILAISISRLETGNWTSYIYKQYNNVGGMLGSHGWIRYDSLDNGIKAFVENLKYGYIDKGLTTVEQIGYKYCPIETEHWINLVNQIYKEES